MTDLVSILAKEIELSLSKKIVDLYHSIQTSFQLHDYKKVGTEAGAFCEGILMALWTLYNNSTHSISGVNFDKKCNKLMNKEGYESNSSMPMEENDRNIIRDESIRVYIPRALLSIYTIRSKRQVAHLRGIEIDYLDALMIVQGTSWVLTEILSLISEIPDEETLNLLQNVGRMHLPIVEWIEDEIVLRKDNISIEEGLLLIITASGGRINHTEAVSILKQNYPKASQRAIYSARDNVIENEWVHRTQSNVLSLRKKGWDEARRLASIP